MTRVLLLLRAAQVAPAAPKLTPETKELAPPDSLKNPVRVLLARSAVRVSDDKGLVATFWLRPETPARKDGTGYRAIPPSTVIGAVAFERPWIDFHHQEIPAGVYTLRIFVQPESKDHEGTAPHRDVCVLTPAAVDARPDPLPIKKLIEQSGTATGGTHPVVMLLFPHPKPGGTTITDRGKGIVTLDVKGSAKADDVAVDLGVAFVIRGVSGGE
jgi:hypothetical protein